MTTQAFEIAHLAAKQSRGNLPLHIYNYQHTFFFGTCLRTVERADRTV